MWNTLRVRMALLTLSALAMVMVSSALVGLTYNDANSGHLSHTVVIGTSVLAPIAVVVLALSYFSLVQLIRPLRRLTEMTEKIANGDMGAAQKTVGGVQEIEQLRRTLDQMAQKVLAAQNALEHFNDQLDRARDKEREDVGLELHDNFLQSLAVLNQQLERMQEQVQRKHPAFVLLSDSRALLADVTSALRRYASNLHPPLLEGVGILPALKGLAGMLGAAFHVYGEAYELEPERERELYYLVREALLNAKKHAQARYVEITIAYSAEELVLTVKDDGLGFNVPADFAGGVRANRLGLMGMQQRARRLDGRLHIDSHPSRGTTVVVHVPLKTGQSCSSSE